MPRAVSEEPRLPAIVWLMTPVLAILVARSPARSQTRMSARNGLRPRAARSALIWSRIRCSWLLTVVDAVAGATNRSSASTARPAASRLTIFHLRVAPCSTSMGRRDVVAEARGCEDLHLVAPRQDPEPDFDGPGDGRPPFERSVGCDIDPLGRMPGGLLDAGCDHRGESQGHVHGRLVSDDVPGPSEFRLDGTRFWRFESARCDSHIPDPLDLEGPQGVSRLVPADQVERVGLQRRLDQVRPDDRSPRRRVGRVARRLV